MSNWKYNYPCEIAYVTALVMAVVEENSDGGDSSGEQAERMTSFVGHSLRAEVVRTPQTHPGADNVYYKRPHTADTVFDAHYLKQNKNYEVSRSLKFPAFSTNQV